MKKSVFTAIFIMTVGASAFAAPTTLTGYVADAKCAKAGKVTGPDHAACAAKCVKAGEDAVLVVGDKVYKVKDQDSITGHVGQQITVTGTLHGTTMDVDTVTIAR